jgi:hypothetical protein
MGQWHMPETWSLWSYALAFLPSVWFSTVLSPRLWCPCCLTSLLLSMPIEWQLAPISGRDLGVNSGWVGVCTHHANTWQDVVAAVLEQVGNATVYWVGDLDWRGSCQSQSNLSVQYVPVQKPQFLGISGLKWQTHGNGQTSLSCTWKVQVGG